MLLTARLALGAGLALAAAQASAQDAPAPEGASRKAIVIGYVSREGDPLYAEPRGRDGVYRPVRRRPLPGAELGVKDAAASARAAGSIVSLSKRSLRPDEDLAPALAELARAGATSAILDLPVADLRAAASAPSGLVLLDIRETDDALRAETCRAPIFHLQPSRLQRTDALAQFLVKRNWKRILVLHGPEDEDRLRAESMQASARKFGARIVATKAFAVTNDPRRREETSAALMTGGAEFDVVYLADSLGDAGRTMPYRIASPRPTVGSHGLDALAWSPYYERHGAPQLNRRFEREAGRPMVEDDWSAWAAVRALAEVEIREARQPTGAPLVERMLDPSLRLELYKGFAGSFRPWDRQLRQPVLLATHNAVVDLAPVEGFLHETNILDTLGLLPTQTPCGGSAR